MNRPSSQTPAHFKDSARHAIYQQLPLGGAGHEVSSVRSAPAPYYNPSSFRSSASSIFSSAKRSVRSAPSIYSSSTATIPEDQEAVSITVEQLVNDITLHETHFSGDAASSKEMAHISLGSGLQYQHQEMFIDWNLNATRCKLMLTHLPMVTSTPDFSYSSTLPQLVGDLARQCHIVLLSPTISDHDLIITLYSSNIYKEHDLDDVFRKNVAEVSVKQSRLLQIQQTSSFNNTHPALAHTYKEIAVRNYLINLAAAASTSHEYKVKLARLKSQAKARGDKVAKDVKKKLWDEVRAEVFHRAGLSE
ncbi:hypothetical protein DIURU_000339 [Diutina rugosa]|uniref:Uncharacterized protein n=1 Tax=Diutina rugosa TaxID=5481 RepID=A0A642UYV1_DIURU|nr:uncharacterized protein DIURU_000339 [Diutina rugosa]KAA8907929.1 hypothetical protein DIURU_000339 [Diutina rugosa]